MTHTNDRKQAMTTCDCHACELGDPAMCYGCPVHGAWCDWFGEGPKCTST